MKREDKIRKNKEIQSHIYSIKNNIPNTNEDLVNTVTFLLSIILEKIEILFPTDSKNSHIPPSADQNRERKPSVNKGRKPGAQKGHKANTLDLIDDPDEVEELKLPQHFIPCGYTFSGYVRRQVFEFTSKRYVKEYKAELYSDVNGNKIHAEFPPHVTSTVQYGPTTRAHTTYLSVHHLIPSLRITEYFNDTLKMPISEGFIFSNITRAYDALEEHDFTAMLISQAISSNLLHADETGVNIAGKKHWIHTLSNANLTYYHVDKKRGKDACNAMAVLPRYTGLLIHDCWGAYFSFGNCRHAICLAHITRELRGISEKHGRRWAENILRFLEDAYEIYKKRRFTEIEMRNFRRRFRQILSRGEKEEEKAKETGISTKKPQNLLLRLRKYESEATRFIFDPDCPYTNNQAENDLRMTKVKMKVSGCFRTLEWARKFYLIRSYISTCRKNGVAASDALNYLFQGHLPPFMMQWKANLQIGE